MDGEACLSFSLDDLTIMQRHKQGLLPWLDQIEQDLVDDSNRNYYVFVTWELRTKYSPDATARGLLDQISPLH
jgi:hypothetical protein